MGNYPSERVGFNDQDGRVEATDSSGLSPVVNTAQTEAIHIDRHVASTHESLVMEMEHLRERSRECSKASQFYADAADQIQNFLSGSSMKKSTNATPGMIRDMRG